MAASIGVVVFFLLGAAALAVPAAIGIYVWRDASARGMNAVLWVLLALLAPGFIGLIIYLVVRSEHSSLRCPACGKPAREDFVNCPWCGTRLREPVTCRNCGTPMEPGWRNCPACGTPVPEEQWETAVPKKDKGLGVLLTILVAVPVVLVAVMAAGIIFSVRSQNVGTWSSTHATDPEDIEELSQDVRDILRERCSGEGVYVLHERIPAEEEGDDLFLLYRNDGIYSVGVNVVEGGWFRKPGVEFQCTEVRSEGETLVLFDRWAEQQPTPVVQDNRGEALEYVYIELDGTGCHMLQSNDWHYEAYPAADERITVTVNMKNCPEGLYGVALHITDENGETIMSQYVCNADGSALSGSDGFMMTAFWEEGCSVSIGVYAANEMLVYETEPAAAEKPGTYEFAFNGSGELKLR